MAKTATTPKQVAQLDLNDQLLMVNEVADYCHIHRARVYALMRSGALPYVLVGSRRRVRMSDLMAYLDAAS